MKTLYRASRVVTLSYPAMGEWVLVDGRHVERVGVGEAPQADRVVDLPGTTVLPGVVETHGCRAPGFRVRFKVPVQGSVRVRTVRRFTEHCRNLELGTRNRTQNRTQNPGTRHPGTCLSVHDSPRRNPPSGT